jgi:hypothetical protein
VGVQTGCLLPITVYFACGSVVLLFLFPKTFAHSANVLGTKIGSSALPEPALSVVEWDAIRHQTRDRLMHISSGRFAGFAHVVVFVVQTPTA